MIYDQALILNFWRCQIRRLRLGIITHVCGFRTEGGFCMRPRREKVHRFLLCYRRLHQTNKGPLTSASFHGNLDYVKLLVKRGASVKMSNDDQGKRRTPLHFSNQEWIQRDR